MKFEDLPNEIFIDLFEYFDVLQIFIIFYNLNTRFNQLLNRSHVLNLQKISKTDFNIHYARYHSTISKTIRSIYIADHDETPDLPTRFFSQYFSASYFPSLRSLTIDSMRSMDTLISLLNHCQQLDHFQQLKLIHCHMSANQHLIWNLPYLTHCSIDEENTIEKTLHQLSTRSNSIKNLALKHFACDSHTLNNILEQTPKLTHLTIAVVIHRLDLPVDLSRLIRLNLSFDGSKEVLFSLFQSMIHLRFLICKIYNFFIDGNEWQKLIENDLIHLEQIHFKIAFKFLQNLSIESQITNLLLTYQTSFWLTERKQYIRCQWDPSDPFQQAYLYTLPYYFPKFHLIKTLVSKSTCSNSNDFWCYDHVDKLAYEKHSSQGFPIRFSRLSQLDLILPFHKNFLSTISSWIHLHTLDVVLLQNDSIYEQLQLILDRAPNLYLLRFSHLSEFDVRLFQLTSRSIRRLDFFTKESMLYNWYFDREQCLAFAQSSLGQQCQTLVIDIDHRSNILEIIEHMSQLRSLTFHCKDDRWKAKSNNDELIQWLHDNLPFQCDIIRNQHEKLVLHIWIR